MAQHAIGIARHDSDHCCSLPIAARGGEVECIGVDFSAAGSGKTIVERLSSTSVGAKYQVHRLQAECLGHQVGGAGSARRDRDRLHPLRLVRRELHRLTAIACPALLDRGNHHRPHRRRLATAPRRSPGRSITTANCNYSLPFECPPIAIWNDTTGSAVTATVEGIWGGGAVPLDDEIWLDVEYLGDASPRRRARSSTTARPTCWRPPPTRPRARKPGAARPPSSSSR